MGLLDQVIGQVIGQMTGAPPPQGQPPRPGSTGGFNLPAGINLPGGLGNVLREGGGRYAPLVMALLAILANRNLSSGAGGYGSVLHDILDRIGGGGGSGAVPDATGAPAPRPGGFLDEIGGMLGGAAGGAASSSGAGGLGGLLEQLGRGGLGDAAKSWVGTGANGAVTPGELDRALGPGTIDALADRFGVERGHLLDQLTEALPQVVDGLTPGGEVPHPDEQARWI